MEGGIDAAPRRVYYELATKSLNNYFPPRVGYGGLSEAELTDARSSFGVSRIYQHPAGQPPQDELDRFVPLFIESSEKLDWSHRLTLLLRGAVQRWSGGECTPEDVRLLNESLQLKFLSNALSASPEIASLVTRYRQLEQQLQPDNTVGSAADWNEGEDAPIGIRGSYTDLGGKVVRGHVRLLNQGTVIGTPSSSRRLEWAQCVASSDNPLTARVYLNRVWHYLFGAGLVHTPLRERDSAFALERGPAGDAIESSIRNYETAARMQTLVPDLCDVSGESPETLALYGVDRANDFDKLYALQCLRARRLAEAGVRFIEITCPSTHANNSPWDQHGELKLRHEENARITDHPVAALIVDLKRRGLLDDTLIVWAGEMGRTRHAFDRRPWPRGARNHLISKGIHASHHAGRLMARMIVDRRILRKNSRFQVISLVSLGQTSLTHE